LTRTSWRRLVLATGVMRKLGVPQPASSGDNRRSEVTATTAVLICLTTRSPGNPATILPDRTAKRLTTPDHVSKPHFASSWSER
jgi:hypothetical protein